MPAAPLEGALPTCAEAGVLGALTGVVGAMMALEVVREIIGRGEEACGQRREPSATVDEGALN